MLGSEYSRNMDAGPCLVLEALLSRYISNLDTIIWCGQYEIHHYPYALTMRLHLSRGLLKG